jgi:feruloyl esterase
MKHSLLALALLVLLVAPHRAVAASCEDLSSLKIADATITAAQTVAATADVPAHCRVALTSKPSADSDIKIEVWLPASGWNGKFQAVGNGGWSGAIDSNGLAGGIRRGYAVASTDQGHQGGAGPWMQNPDKLIDFGYRATHQMAVAGKAIVNAFYGNPARLSYFTGCSAGGRQALKEAQRFPEDFDGIVAGAPALNTTGRAAFSMWIAQHQHTDEASFIPPAKFPAIHEAVLQACDARDGVTDRVIENPRACTFDPKAMECKAGDATSCLTAPQVETARAMYKPAVNTRTGKEIFPGLERGSELGWTTFGNTQPFPIGVQMYQQLFDDPEWNYKSLNFDADMARVDALEKGNVNAMDPNLKPFIARGGKLIQYHGWADQQIPSGSSVEYFTSVQKTLGADAIKNNYRLYMVPGMGHCGGGDGPASFDMFAALEQWVEKGKAPDAIPASHLTAGKVDRTRILCSYPQVATYKGSGDPNDAANFACR